MNDFTFSFQSGGTRIETSFFAETWHEALTKFVSFLGNVHGYDLTKKIAADINPFAINREAWTGPVFNPEESL